MDGEGMLTVAAVAPGAMMLLAFTMARSKPIMLTSLGLRVPTGAASRVLPALKKLFDGRAVSESEVYEAGAAPEPSCTTSPTMPLSAS